MFRQSFNINRIVRKYCEKVCNESRMVAAQFLLDIGLNLVEIMDTFRHSVSLLSLTTFVKLLHT